MSTVTDRLRTALAARYRIQDEIGAGGMATVYRAQDLKHDREVALKVLRPELAAVLGAERFLNEIRIAARLDHPHILTLIDSGAANDVLYYVLPFVRGESLRAKLNREGQLPIEEALAITRQVAGALDYAHRLGIVHRDIKPENILLQEGEAILADFGIAIAVQEAGGQRLTDTGLSLGTPQYMSPEQATGDRHLDARSDVYALGVVLYEMLAGEPPMTGPTAQAVIAKLLTERPVRLRVVRTSVTEGIDDAVAKALAKAPADRFPSAGSFVAALEAGVTAPRSGRFGRVAAGIAVLGIATIAVIGALVATWNPEPSAPTFALRERVQLTASGNVVMSAIAPDGKQLAFATRNCGGTECTYALDVQDVGGTGTHRILDGTTSNPCSLEWSPDRRHLIFCGSVGGRWGFWVVSALAGRPRYLTSSSATFWAGGDSLLVAPEQGQESDTVFYVRVTSIDGAVRDSIRIAGAGPGVARMTVSPRGRWMAVRIGGLWKVIDRSGALADSMLGPSSQGRATRDALWVSRCDGGSCPIVRMALDHGSGRFQTRRDTVYTGTSSWFTITADGSALVTDDGAYEYSVWAVDLADALQGRFPESRRVLRTSTPIIKPFVVSPDGTRLLFARTLPSSGGRSETRLSIMLLDTGTETVLATQNPTWWRWLDSTTVAVSTLRNQRLAVWDIRSGVELRSLDLPASQCGFQPLPDGWAWVPGAADGCSRVIVQRRGRTIDIPKPAWFTRIYAPTLDPTGRRLAFNGWGGGGSGVDTGGVAVVPLDGGNPEIWASAYSESLPNAQFLDDGSILFVVTPTSETYALYRLRGPGVIDTLGQVPKPLTGLSVSADLRRAAVLTRDYHGDAWMHRVVRQ